ncbi:MAG: hypothetical protein HRU19_01505 [Pseudobacteriovorax sp.]|nr:hypothetical protein [Pseudobacteriovorax sp.]
MAGIRTPAASSSSSCSVYRVNVDIAKVYSGNTSASGVLDYGIGRDVVVDVASAYEENPFRRIYVKPRAGTTYAGQGVWMSLDDLACVN